MTTSRFNFIVYLLLYVYIATHASPVSVTRRTATKSRSSFSKTVGRLHKRNHVTAKVNLISGVSFGRDSRTPSFKFNPTLDDNSALNTLRNKKIVFLGDSITRYQYLNLVYFIERGHFPQPYCTDEKMEHSVCCQNKVRGGSKGNGWSSFFHSTNQGLNGNEICDCARKDGFNLENRVYRNEEMNTVIAFFWLGRDLGINLREGMFNYPLRPACVLTGNNKIDSDNSSCNNIVVTASKFDNVTLIGDAIRNITVSLKPDMFILNWGHHTTYSWQKGVGRQQYESISQAINDMKVKSSQTKTLFYWKATTPIFSCDRNKKSQSLPDEPPEPRCRLKFLRESDGQNPVQLGNKLVQDRTLEIFDTQYYIKVLFTELQRRRGINKILSTANLNENATLPWCSPSTNINYAVCQYNPLGWDSLHFYCWVNAELNRALIANFKMKMSRSTTA